jgi:hypothetical protein
MKDSPLQLSFFVFFCAILATFFLPYLRSLLVIPMLYNRYTMVVVPLFLMAMAFAFALIPNRPIQMITILTFVVLSLTDIILLKKYYAPESITKTQFRQVSEFMSLNQGAMYPVVEDVTGNLHRFYLRKFGNREKIFTTKKEGEVNGVIDSIVLRAAPQYDVNGFWYAGAHGFRPNLNPAVQKRLDSTFYLAGSNDFHDAWAKLYLRGSSTTIIPTFFSGQLANYFSSNVLPIWGGTVSSTPVSLSAGGYYMVVESLGTPAGGELPRLSFKLNDIRLGAITTPGKFGIQRTFFELPSDTQGQVSITLDNDGRVKDEDRNVFVRYLSLVKIDFISIIPGLFREQMATYYSESVVPLFGGKIESKPVTLGPGRYNLLVESMGTKARDQFPHLVIDFDTLKIADFTAPESFAQKEFLFEVPKGTTAPLIIDLDNDLSENGEDRNAFIKSIAIVKL